MRSFIRYGLIAGAVVTAAIGVAGAGMQNHPAPVNSRQGGHLQQPRGHGRGGQRFLGEYDLNHDGKVTRDEFNKATAQQFAQAGHGAKFLTAAQYEAFRTRTLHQHADQIFRRADWNSDGKLTFDEFANPIRASFARADRQSAGAILCHPRSGDNGQSSGQPHRRRGGSRGVGAFCARDDLNHDGRITRAELDQALHQQFAPVAKGGSMTKEQFEAMQHSRAEATSGRTFGRIDSDGDGKVSLQEFTAYQQRTFTRMDENGDGTITRDEMSSRRNYASHSSNRT